MIGRSIIQSDGNRVHHTASMVCAFPLLLVFTLLCRMMLHISRQSPILLEDTDKGCSYVTNKNESLKEIKLHFIYHILYLHHSDHA